MSSKFPIEATEEFTKLFTSVKKKNTCIILINGEQIVTRSKKSSWASKGAAKNALHSHIKYVWQKQLFQLVKGRCHDYNIDRNDDHDMYKAFLIEMETAGVLEYREVS